MFTLTKCFHDEGEIEEAKEERDTFKVHGGDVSMEQFERARPSLEGVRRHQAPDCDLH